MDGAAAAVTLALIASLLVNVLLGVALFFKSALNEIFSTWYKERRQRREEKRKVLLELNERMTSFGDDYVRFLGNLSLQQRAASAEEMALAEKNFTEAENAIQETQAFLDRHELVFPEPVRRLIPDLRQAMLISADDVRMISKEQLLRIAREVPAATKRIKDEVAKRIR